VPRGTPTDSSTTDGPSWKPCGPGLSGPLPSSLGNAGALKILDLSFHNQLTGGLPAGMPDSLEFMDLSYTGLGGNVAGEEGRGHGGGGCRFLAPAPAPAPAPAAAATFLIHFVYPSPCAPPHPFVPPLAAICPSYIAK
jgi:hypothetical protein